MTDIITSVQYWQQWEEHLQAGHGEIACHTNGFDRIGRCHHRYSQDYFWEVELRPGFWLEFLDDMHQRSFAIANDHDESMPLVSKFYLSGTHRVLTPNVQGIKSEYEEKAGQSYLFFLPDIQETEFFVADQRLQLVRISLDIAYLQSLGLINDSLPVDLQRLLEPNSNYRFHHAIGQLTPAMELALQQILHCPYTGITKRIYLESKALELLALQLDQWIEEQRQCDCTHSLHPDDVERLHQAKDILIHDLQNPPSLMDLARQIGLNDYKLKYGFRQVFGTTVFGYLQACRMEQAKQLLAERRLSIAAVAHTVGYASQSRFCHAFKRRYGITPIAYRTAS